jgi:autotransporter-associated beta strand protein
VKQLFNNFFIFLVIALMAFPGNSSAQRKVEKLGRGVVATNTGSGNVYVSWRFFAQDPENIGFNVYRSINGAAAVKRNATPILNVTNYTDAGASTSQTNSYYVTPVINGVEGAPCKSFTIPGSTTAKSYFIIPLNNTFLTALGLVAADYTIPQIYVGDLDGDGEFDYVVKRLPVNPVNNIMLQAYKSDGTFLWTIDLGKNVEQGAPTHNPFVLVYDFDGDGKAEVMTRSGVGTKFSDGYTIPTLASGVTDYRTLPAISLGYMLNSDNVPEYISMVDGMTGKEITRTDNIPRGPQANWTAYWGDNYGHRMNMSYAAIAYLDGVHPSIVTSRGHEDLSDFMALDYSNKQFTVRWKWSPRNNPNTPAGYHWSDFHNIRVADVDGDGKDEIAYGINTMDDNGTPLYWGKNDTGHGDRFNLCDIDPDRPGLECYSIQQATNVLAIYYDAKTGERLKTWASATPFDVGRGDVADIDPRYTGMEMWSYAHEAMLNDKGEIIPSTSFPHPALSIWWDGDLMREGLDAADGNGYNPIITKWNYTNQTNDRLLNLYSEGGGYSTKTPYAGRAALYGDILGDWREEVFCENDLRTEIRIFSSTTANTNRIYCLMQDPEYRLTIPLKGYLPSTEVDYFLGQGMSTPPMPPILDIKRVWKGGQNSNVWDSNTTNWSTADAASSYVSGDSVMFDLTGKLNTNIQLSGSITPGYVVVNSPNDYTLGGTGSIDGTTNLLKSGKSTLTLATKCSYTGVTKVDDGALYVNSKLSGSTVTVNFNAYLGGTDTIVKPVTLKNGAKIAPGTTTTVGDLKLGSNLTLTGKNICYFDITDDSTGLVKQSDKIEVTGNLTFSGTNYFVFNKLNGVVKPGNYPLIKYSGTLTGTTNSVILSGLYGQKYALKDTLNTIWLVVQATRSSSSVVWAGTNSKWDFLTTSDWLKSGSSDVFAMNDSVTFNATGSAQKVITLVGELPIGQMTIETGANDYSFTGTGSIAGAGGLTKNGTGALKILNATNSYTGKNIINGGTVEVSGLALAGENSSLGASTNTSAAYISLTNTKLSYKGAYSSLTNRGITITGQDTIDMATAKTVTLSGAIAGTGQLVKTGVGNLALLGTNTYSGGTVVKTGNIDLGAGGTFGSGTVTFMGGSVNVAGNYPSAGWNISVPQGATGTITTPDYCNFSGSLTGAGTLGIMVPFVREEFSGNWSAFTGTVNVTTDADGGELRLNNTNGYANTTFNLAQAGVHLFYNPAVSTNNGAQTVNIGALTGVANSALYDENWVIGSKNTDATFNGKIYSNALTKVGTGVLTLTDTCYFTNSTSVNGGTLALGPIACLKGSLVVNTAGTIAGNGTIVGLGALSGTIAPGINAIGKLMFNNNISFGTASNTFIEAKKLPAANDVISSTGTITYNGTLNITNIGTTAFTEGDSIVIFKATKYAGAFKSIVPAIPGDGLYWDISALATRGVIRVTKVLAVKTLTDMGITIAPNPVKDNLHITFETENANTVVAIYSMNGKLMYNQKADNTELTIPMSKYRSGAYIVRVTTATDVAVSSIIKQ